MTQRRILVMMDKKNAYVLNESQSKMPIALAKDKLKRDKKYFPFLHCFHPEWYIEEHYVITPRNLPNFTDARNMLMSELRGLGYNII